ncbi:MAG: S8 family serine peptidase [Woeseia sp.]
MNTTALKTLYIILGASALSLAAQPAAAQAGLGPVNRTIDRSLERRLPRVDDRLDAELRRKAEEAERAAAEAERAALEEANRLPADALGYPGALTETTDALAGTVANSIAGTGQDLAGTLRPFIADVDPFGNAIEQNTLVVLIEREQLALLRAQGLAVVAERDMPGLGLALVTLRAAQGYGLAEKALELQNAFPGAAVDYNHLYFLQDAEALPDRATSEITPGEAGGPSGNATERAASPASNSADAELRIGLIDSALMPQHFSLQDLTITARDFVTHDAERPAGHGTAVASVIARAGVAPVAIYSAGVFFKAPGHAPGASTESLIAALDWLAAAEVDAINMSLAGPANSLLEQALSRLAARHGPAVIAAVGNNGPAGEPMYPGAYDSVLGVTAVDRKQQVFRYANRGAHVDFAALGVDVKVADANGGWRLESGTSMAAPRVAVIVGALHRDSAASGEELRALLISHARDLGRPGFDPVFGYGLLTEPPELVSRLKTQQQD